MSDTNESKNSQVMGLTLQFNKLLASCGSDIFYPAFLALELTGPSCPREHPLPVNQIMDMIKIARRIHDVMPGIDEPRYSVYDYADAINHARQQVDIDKLMALDDNGFAAALIWLATDKRETYEDREHQQEPLEVNIYV